MRHKLDNGLTVLLKENHGARVVAFQAWVQAGSGDETDSESGLAHLHEHMLFKGTADRGVGMMARDVEAAGGDINASTSHDQTVYHLVMPSREFATGLEILSDALRRSTFDEKELQKEKEVILEEIKRTEDMPGGRLSRHLFDLAYRVHPYRRPVLGTSATIESFSRDDVLSFYRKHYRPQKTTLVLVGDFEERDALKRIRALFEDWSPALGAGESEPPSPRTLEPEPDGLALRIMVDDVRETYLALAWPVPNISHEDIAALDVLSVILGNGESSRLITALRRRRHVVNGANAYVYSPRDPGLFIVGGQAPTGKAAEALSGMLEETYRFRNELVTDAELDKAKTMIESDMVYQSQTVQGQARWLGFFECTAGAVEFEDVFYRRVGQVGAKDVQRAAKTYLLTPRLVVAGLVTKDSSLDESTARGICEEAERTTVEKAGSVLASSKGSSRGQPRETEVLMSRLSSGATLLVQPDSSVPLIAMRVVQVGGQRFETEQEAGVSNLASQLLTGGTSSRDAEEIARLVDGWAGSLNGSSGRNSFGMEGEVLARNFEPALRLLSECLASSSFPEEELEKERELLLEELSAKEDFPAEMAFDLFRETLWRSHPYRMDLRGTEESLRGLDSVAVREHVRRHYHPSRMHLAVVGCVQPERVSELAESLFGQEAVGVPQKLEPLTIEVEDAPSEPREARRRLSKEQAHIVLGFPGVRLSDPERFTLEVISTVLSGQGGRLFVELRDRRSMAYSVGSYSQEGLDPGFFCVYIGCSPEKVDEATEAIRTELARVRDARVLPDELERARRYLIGSHEIGLQRPAARAAVLSFDEAYGLGHMAHREYAERIEAISADMILDVAQRYLEPRREVLAVVGP